MDQADGNVQVLVQIAAEEVAGRGETADRLRAALDPLALEVVQRRLACPAVGTLIRRILG